MDDDRNREAPEGEDAPREVARELSFDRCATFTLCCSQCSTVVPSGTGLDATLPANGPSFRDRDW